MLSGSDVSYGVCDSRRESGHNRSRESSKRIRHCWQIIGDRYFDRDSLRGNNKMIDSVYYFVRIGLYNNIVHVSLRERNLLCV